jgi:glutamyl-tRNA synthetase
MELDWAQEQDHVIQRADGSCLYHLASVVDDHAMEITHVIRAEEHLSNTPRQLFIARSLGYELPKWAHLPFVAEPSSKVKLSKRKLSKYLKNADFAQLNEHGRAIAEAIGLEVTPEAFSPVVVDFYEKVGYLPQAIVNYLLLLGWALDDKTEFFTREEMIEHFSLERVNPAAASFDPLKLSAFQLHYMQAVAVEEKTALALPYLERAGLVPSPVPEEVRARVLAVVAAAGDRIRVAGDILNFPEFFVPDEDVVYDEKDLAKWIGRAPEAAGWLAGFRETAAGTDLPDREAWDSFIKEFVAAGGMKVGSLVQAVRVAVTGKGIGFGLSEGLAILGKTSSIARMDRLRERLK